jgi:uncharacterized RDD family membrane protein YckC
MKCPKCQYITFEEGDRCRNCGYDFSLTVEAPELDLPIKTGDEALGPLADFDLSRREEASPAPTSSPTPSDLEEARPRKERSAELPLFVDRGLDDDRPLVSLPAVPRPPVAVRKSTRTVPPRLALDEAESDSDIPPRRSAAGAAVQQQAEPRPSPQASRATEARTGPASAGARLLGGAIDVGLLGGIDLAVLYLTLRLCDLEFSQVAAIPLAPFLAFLALLNGGYATAFTAAGGQSIGKMAAGTRVVNADESAWTDRVPLGQAVVRAAGYAVSALPAGMGFLPAFFGPDGRAVHDRIAHTRVVKA